MAKSLTQEKAPENIVDKFPELERLIASCEAGTLAIGNKIVTVSKKRETEGLGDKPRFETAINIALQDETNGNKAKAMTVDHVPTTFKNRNGPGDRISAERRNGYLGVSIGKKPVADAVEEVTGWEVRTDILGVEEMGRLIALLEAVRGKQEVERQRQVDALTQERNGLRRAANEILQAC